MSDDPNEAYDVVPIEPGPMGRLRVDRQAEWPFDQAFSRQGKGSAIRDRSGIQSEPSRRKGPGEGEGELTGNEKSTDRGLSLAERKALRARKNAHAEAAS